ncbi:MAG: DUF2301 domain-containing membrane protein [Deltaproteobacteria bacterium]|jgi:uncharacterized integral membrane protein|nr:DUF2301 domain-containing membrane protein [Deltaproteobacteria bacterium]MCL5892832.1 DUF2301 domain-containing membrane protein [Deltaproteobacteria bacterium]MDA8053796.1 DUF2301 domain-containing membrane protein [Deltaproteobacteria bacterium]
METDIYYPKTYDIIYRSGYVIGFLGILLFALSYLFSNWQGFALGISVFYLGSLISGIFLLVWKKEVKIFILSCIILGIIFGAGFLFFRNPEILIISMGFVLAGLAGLYGKEAHCFHFIEGWILMWSFPFLIFANLLLYGLKLQNNDSVHIIFSIIYLVIMLLALSFLIKKLRQPLMQFCQNQD